MTAPRCRAPFFIRRCERDRGHRGRHWEGNCVWLSQSHTVGNVDSVGYVTIWGGSRWASVDE